MSTTTEHVDATAAELRLLRESFDRLENIVRTVGVTETCSACGSTAELNVGAPTEVNVALNYVNRWRREHFCSGRPASNGGA